ncbi:MAG: CapA family protein, partial [Sneathiellales bacterium]|nr:CapA family protein [Sneathiellales bacterium]
ETESNKEQSVGNQFSIQSNAISMFMCGDVMLGRGIDQVLPYPGNPVLYEGFMKSARGYVDIAEQKSGPIPYPVSYPYIWGDALEELERMLPDLRIINLETSITKCNDHWKNKGINYRMNPENIACLSVAQIDYCALANNHVLDWGYKGLTETIETLNKVSIKSSGAGLSLQEAQMPAIFEIKGKGRVLIFSFGFISSGIPLSWAALEDKQGVFLIKDYSTESVISIKKTISEFVQDDDIIVASIHWGGNWGYELNPEQVRFAHQLIDKVGVDVIHGHSSHHVKGIEVYKNRLIIYGSGDFLNDYEGIRGHESYRGDLGLMYFVGIEPATGKLLQLQMTPTRIKRFRINRANKSEA